MDGHLLIEMREQISKEVRIHGLSNPLAHGHSWSLTVSSFFVAAPTHQWQSVLAFRRILASLQEAMYIHPSVCPSCRDGRMRLNREGKGDILIT